MKNYPHIDEEMSKHDNLYKFIAIFLLPASLLFPPFFLFWMFYILWYFGYYIRTNNDRKYKVEQEKQKRIWEAEDADHFNALLEENIKYKRQEMLEKNQKIKLEEYQKYSDLRKQIELMPISDRWKQDVKEKCGNMCQMCGSNKNLQVHHRDSFYLILKQNGITSIEKAFECKQLWDLDNGEVLCEECHDKMESSKKRQSLISKII